MYKRKNLTIDYERWEVRLKGKRVHLSKTEFRILKILLSSDKIVSQKELERWVLGKVVNSNKINVYIHSIRSKLGKGVIRTQRGVGYIGG